MIELGKKQELTVIKRVEFGVYLGEQEGAEERVLLPKKQVPEGTEVGSKLTVFVYKDSKDRLISTTNEPKLELGGLAVLKVAQVGKIGAFLDWGWRRIYYCPSGSRPGGYMRARRCWWRSTSTRAAVSARP